MEDNTKKSRRGLKVGLSAAAIATILGVVAATSSSAPNSSSMQSAAVVNAVAPLEATGSMRAAATEPAVAPQAVEAATTTTEQRNDLSNDHYYTNNRGDTVHTPAYDLDNDIPLGATARCGDGTYSFSESHRGTCSHHGGVSTWP